MGSSQSHSTVVANGYTKLIWVKIETEPWYFKFFYLSLLSINESTSCKYFVLEKFAKQNNFEPISIGSYQKFHTESSQDAVYITILFPQMKL